MEVALVRWPSEQEMWTAARDAHRPCLLLVEGDAHPPVGLEDLEDWIRVPAPDVDLRVRVDGLRRRAHAQVAPPEIDADGVLRVDGRWVSLPPVEARLAGALVVRFGAVVSREALAEAAWPAGAPGRNALDVHVGRLRRRLTPLALAIRTIRSRGYLLEHAPGASTT